MACIEYVLHCLGSCYRPFLLEIVGVVSTVAYHCTSIISICWNCITVGKLVPKASGETTKQTWYALIPPKVVEELRKKNLPQRSA